MSPGCSFGTRHAAADSRIERSVGQTRPVRQRWVFACGTIGAHERSPAYRRTAATSRAPLPGAALPRFPPHLERGGSLPDRHPDPARGGRLAGVRAHGRSVSSWTARAGAVRAALSVRSGRRRRRGSLRSSPDTHPVATGAHGRGRRVCRTDRDRQHHPGMDLRSDRALGTVQRGRRSDPACADPDVGAHGIDSGRNEHGRSRVPGRRDGGARHRGRAGRLGGDRRRRTRSMP